MSVGLECSESQQFYIETNRKLEKWIKILDVAFLKVTPAMKIWPTIIVSILTYYYYSYSTTDLSEGTTAMTDLRESVFELPMPMW